MKFNIIINILLLYVLSCHTISARNVPEIIDISSDKLANIGDDIELNCTLRNVGEKTVSWVKYATEFESESPGSSVVLSMRNILSISDSRYSIQVLNGSKDQVTYNFKITKAEASDMGVYECLVIVTVTDKVSRKLTLQIKHPPVVSEARTPKSTLVTEGNNLEVTCYALGFPQPTIYWTREHDDIMPAGGLSTQGATLKVKSAHRLDRGNYYCNADNGMGAPARRLVRVEVEFRPQISTSRPKVAQMPSYAVELECTVEAYPAPAVFWQRNGNKIVSNRYYEISNTASAYETTTSVLRIASVSKSDYGDYYCNATNKLGHADARLHLFEPVIPVKY